MPRIFSNKPINDVICLATYIYLAHDPVQCIIKRERKNFRRRSQEDLHALLGCSFPPSSSQLKCHPGSWLVAKCPNSLLETFTPVSKA